MIVTTPEKWDGISRNWQNRGYVQKVGLLILDEIHLLGNDRCAQADVSLHICSATFEKLHASCSSLQLF